MNPGLFLLFGQASDTARETAARTAYRFTGISALLDERWQLGLLALVAALLLAYVVWLYRRDTVELRPGYRLLLPTLRLTVLALGLFYFLQLERRSEREVVVNSRALVLVDTSESMSQKDDDPRSTTAADQSRIDAVIEELQNGELVPAMRKVHDVTVARFDRDMQRVATLYRTGQPESVPSPASGDPASQSGQRQHVRWWLATAAGLALLAIICFAFFLATLGRAQTLASWAVYASVVSGLAALAVVAFADLKYPQVDFLAALGWDEAVAAEEIEASGAAGIEESAKAAAEDARSAGERGEEQPVNWSELLTASGPETRLGSALKRLIDEEQGTPVSAVVVISDGAQNGGLEIGDVATVAKRAKLPVYTVGIGSDYKRPNIRMVDFTAPSRAYPKDEFSVTGFVQADNYLRSRVLAELYVRDANAAADTAELVARKDVPLNEAGQVTPVRFDLSVEETGRRTYRLQLADVAPEDDPEDNAQVVDVEILDRQTRVLLLAGAASREYQFLRNQFKRDEQVELDALLQAPQSGSGGSLETLDAFPATKEELYEYDAIVAIDPDWTALDSVQFSLLENWVAEEAGGLIVVAGPVYTPQWIMDGRLAALHNLYPVIFKRRESALSIDGYEAQKAWPVAFTEAGQDAEFLRLEDSSVASEGTWQEFSGVYEFFDIKQAKPGATVYAHFSNADATLTGELPVYMAGHIYGAGRVFYLGSGEMWRLRQLDEGYFEKLYVKLIRHVSQGRLLRGSQRGLLLVEHDRYRPGDTVVVRAQLSDAQYEPLTLPSVNLQVTQPDNTTKTVVLKASGKRPGMYEGQFTVFQERGYRLDLALPDESQDQLTKRILVQGSHPEKIDPQRNDALLGQLASATGGQYYIGLAAAAGQGDTRSLASQLRDRSETTTIAGTPDKQFAQRLMQWLLALAAAALTIEWLSRRLCKLA